MANRWWVPAAAAAAVVVIGAGSVLVLRKDGGGPAAAPTPVSTLEQLRVRNGDMVTASGTVVVAPGKPPRFCAPAPVAGVGTTGPEQPPDCSLGVDLVGVDAARLTGVKTFATTRWGQAGITGRYAGGTITVTAQDAPVATPGPDLLADLPDGPPCPAPDGGWRPGPIGESRGLSAFVHSHPTAYGEIVMTYPDGRPTGDEATTEVLLVTTTMPVAVAEKELRAHYTGNLCVRPAGRSRAEVDAVWTRVAFDRQAVRHGAYSGGPDHFLGRVRVQLMVLDDAAYGWLSGAAEPGGPAVEADPWLRPVR